MPVDPGIQPAVHLYRLGTNRVAAAADGVSREDLLRAPTGTNPLIWSWGHLANSRCGLAMMLGVDRERFHPELFNKGAEFTDVAELPDEAEVRQCWEEVTAQLEERFESMTDEDLSQEAPRKFSIPDGTLRGAVTFLAYHEAYHTGQMALVRKWLGLGRLVG